MSAIRRHRRHTVLERHGRYYNVAPAGTGGWGRGHVFRSSDSAVRWAKVRSRISRTTWHVYRFER
jgi:hypothetical protein